MQQEFFKCRVTDVIDPSDFYGQLGTDEQFHTFATFEEALNRYANDYVRAHRGHQLTVEQVHVRDYVLVESGSNVWRRAVIANSDVLSQEVDVQYIDYHTTEIVSVNKICKELPPFFQDIPQQALKCRLYGVRPIVGRTWIKRACDLFHNAVTNKVVDCTYHGDYQDSLVLELFVYHNGQIQSMGEMLVQSEVAASDCSHVAGGGPSPAAMIQSFNLDGLADQFKETDHVNSDDDHDLSLSASEDEASGRVVGSSRGRGRGRRRHAATDSGGQDTPPATQTAAAGASPARSNSRHHSSPSQRGKNMPVNRYGLPSDRYSNADSGSDGGKKSVKSQQQFMNQVKKFVESDNGIGWLPPQQQQQQQAAADDTSTQQQQQQQQQPGRQRDRLNQDRARYPSQDSESSLTNSPHKKQSYSDFRRKMGNSGSNGNHGNNGNLASAAASKHQDEMINGMVESLLEKSDSRSTLDPAEDKPHGAAVTQRDLTREERRRWADRASDQEKANEYEWLKARFISKLSKCLEEINNDTFDSVMSDIDGLVFPAASQFEGLDGRRELCIYIEHLMRVYVEEPREFRSWALLLLSQYNGMEREAYQFANEEFSTYLSENTYKHLNTYVRVSTATKVKKQAMNMVSLLADLWVESQMWDERAHSSMTFCVRNEITKWTDSGVKKLCVEQQELYADCLHTLLATGGRHLRAALATDIAPALAEVRRRLLAPDTHKSLREKYLAILLLPEDAPMQGYEDSTAAGSGQTASPPRHEASTQTDVPAPQSDAECQADLALTTSSVSGEGQSLPISSEEEPPPAEEDVYAACRLMLSELHLSHLLPVFVDNAVRDSVLTLDFSDLKDLLKECGLKAGHILEIKAYLYKRVRSDTPSSVCSSSLTPRPLATTPPKPTRKLNHAADELSHFDVGAPAASSRMSSASSSRVTTPREPAGAAGLTKPHSSSSREGEAPAAAADNARHEEETAAHKRSAKSSNSSHENAPESATNSRGDAAESGGHQSSFKSVAATKEVASSRPYSAGSSSYHHHETSSGGEPRVPKFSQDNWSRYYSGGGQSGFQPYHRASTGSSGEKVSPPSDSKPLKLISPRDFEESGRHQLEEMGVGDVPQNHRDKTSVAADIPAERSRPPYHQDDQYYAQGDKKRYDESYDDNNAAPQTRGRMGPKPPYDNRKVSPRSPRGRRGGRMRAGRGVRRGEQYDNQQQSGGYRNDNYSGRFRSDSPTGYSRGGERPSYNRNDRGDHHSNNNYPRDHSGSFDNQGHRNDNGGAGYRNDNRGGGNQSDNQAGSSSSYRNNQDNNGMDMNQKQQQAYGYDHPRQQHSNHRPAEGYEPRGSRANDADGRNAQPGSSSRGGKMGPGLQVDYGQTHGEMGFMPEYMKSKAETADTARQQQQQFADAGPPSQQRKSSQEDHVNGSTTAAQQQQQQQQQQKGRSEADLNWRAKSMSSSGGDSAGNHRPHKDTVAESIIKSHMITSPMRESTLKTNETAGAAGEESQKDSSAKELPVQRGPIKAKLVNMASSQMRVTKDGGKDVTRTPPGESFSYSEVIEAAEQRINSGGPKASTYNPVFDQEFPSLSVAVTTKAPVTPDAPAESGSGVSDPLHRKPTLREAVAEKYPELAAPAAPPKSREEDYDTDSSRRYLSHRGADFKIPMAQQTITSAFGGGHRVCSSCGSKSHTTHECPDKSKNFFRH